MGREKAAIAIAIVSTKDPAHFRTTAGGYFHGMVTKAKAGHLNLDRTLWGMRKANEPRSRARRVASGARRGRAFGDGPAALRAPAGDPAGARGELLERLPSRFGRVAR